MFRNSLASLAAGLTLLASNGAFAAGTISGVSDAVETHIKRGAPQVQDLNEIQDYVSKHPEDLHGRFVLAELLASGGYQTLATEQLNDIYNKNPKQILDDFHALLKNQSYETARWVGYYVSKKFPKDSGVLFMEGRQALLKNQKTRALNFFAEALQQNPVWPDTYATLSQLLYSLSRRDEAIKYADKALAIKPNDESALAVKAASQAELSGHPQTYIKELERAAPRNRMNDSIHIMLTQGYLNQGRYADASIPALYALEYAQGPQKKVAEKQVKAVLQKVPAAKLLQELNEISPLNAQDYGATVLRLRFARLLSEIGAHKQSAEILLGALNMNPYFTPQLNFRIAKEMDAMNEPQQALLFYQMAAKLAPDDEEYRTTFVRAEMRYKNEPNDLARRLKKTFKPHSRN